MTSLLARKEGRLSDVQSPIDFLSFFLFNPMTVLGINAKTRVYPGWLSGKEPSCQRRRRRKRRFDAWVRKISWRRKWQPAPISLDIGGTRRAIVHGVAKSQTQLSAHTPTHIRNIKDNYYADFLKNQMLTKKYRIGGRNKRGFKGICGFPRWLSR